MDSEGNFQKFLEDPTYPSHNSEQILFRNLEEILLKFRGNPSLDSGGTLAFIGNLSMDLVKGKLFYDSGGTRPRILWKSLS